MLRTAKWILSLLLGCLCASFSSAQVGEVSGVPGDGIPDFYYFAEETTVMMSSGPVRREAGHLVVDTDGTDVVAMLVGGPDVTLSCGLCSGNVLPGIDYLANVSNWVVGYSPNGRTEWLRTNPLTGRGFIGVLGEEWIDGDGNAQPWSGGGFPPFVPGIEIGAPLGYYDSGLTPLDFTNTFEDPNGRSWEVGYGGDTTGLLLTNVTVVPEPSTPVGLMLLSTIAFLRRRIA
ncbi:MAG: PEP-CTERM sorting domain-containing protein [Planctomycetota bacterium]